MPENTTAVSDPAPTVNTTPQPTAPVITPTVATDPSPAKKSNSILWIVILAVVTLLALGGAYLYTQGYFGTTTETVSTPSSDTSSGNSSAEEATLNAELTSSNAEITALEADLAKFESESSTF